MDAQRGEKRDERGSVKKVFIVGYEVVLLASSRDPFLSRTTGKHQVTSSPTSDPENR